MTGTNEEQLLTDADLAGTGWTIGRTRRRNWDAAQSAVLDDAVQYDDSVPAPHRIPSAEPIQNEVADGRWVPVEHASGTRAFLRLQRQVLAMPEEVRITGVVFLPWRPGDPITGSLLREIPIAKIEVAINKRLIGVQRIATIAGGKIVLPSGRTIREKDIYGPLGDPRQDPDFYELVALQHAGLARNGDRNPSATIALTSGVPLSTAQGWVTKARNRGLLPPGRPGRAG